MTVNQEEKILMNLKKNIQDKVFQRGISMAKLVRDIDMSEPGFYKMLDSGSMKVKTLVKISEVLDTPLTSFFSAPGDFNYQSVKGDNNKTGINSSFSDDLQAYQAALSDKEKLIKSLEKALDDKDKIIALLEKSK